MAPTIRAAIFDLDGVVVDTVELHYKAWSKMFAEYGARFNFELYKERVDGIPRDDGARAILTDLPGKEIDRAARLKQSYFLRYVRAKKGIPVYHSTLRLMEELKSKGIKLSVISASKNCKMILRKVKLLDKLDGVVDGHMVHLGKPHPEVFLRAARDVKTPPRHCVVFEDAVLGVEAAKNAKMICVGIDRHGDRERLTKADLVVGDLDEVNYRMLETLTKKGKT